MYSGVNLFYPKRAMSGGNPIAAQSTTVSTVSISATGYPDATTGSSPVQFVAFDIQDNNVRVRWDGTAPTSTVGTILYAGTNYTWNVTQYNSAKFIRISTASADATIFAHPMTS